MLKLEDVEQLATGLLPVALALLAAVLASVLFIQAQRSRKPDAASQAVSAKQTFTRAEVAKHKTERDVWIILKNKVYDVTGYVEEHPGGLAILNNAGKDSTEGFYGPQHPDRVFDLIDDFHIGELAD